MKPRPYDTFKPQTDVVFEREYMCAPFRDRCFEDGKEICDCNFGEACRVCDSDIAEEDPEYPEPLEDECDCDVQEACDICEPELGKTAHDMTIMEALAKKQHIISIDIETSTMAMDYLTPFMTHGDRLAMAEKAMGVEFKTAAPGFQVPTRDQIKEYMLSMAYSSDVLANMGVTPQRIAKFPGRLISRGHRAKQGCAHQPVETGTRTSWCSKCDVNFVMNNGHWVEA